MSDCASANMYNPYLGAMLGSPFPPRLSAPVQRRRACQEENDERPRYETETLAPALATPAKELYGAGKSNKTTMYIIIAVVVLLGLGGGLYWMHKRNAAASPY